MEDSEGVLSFDFEGGLDSGPAAPTASMPVVNSDTSAAINSSAASGPASVLTDPASAASGGPGRRSFRQTVCRHWLRSLCMKGENCGFLHQYDKSRMPVCRFFRVYGECREQDCVYKHTNEDIKECNMYKLGFCPNGPDCRYRHAKQPGPPPPVEEVLQKIQQLYAYNSHKFFQQRNTNFSQHTDKTHSQGVHTGNQVAAGKASAIEPANIPHHHQQQQQQQQQQQIQQPHHDIIQTQMQNVPNGQPNHTNRTSKPLPQGISRYFIVKSCNRENLELSVQQGVWATQRSNEAKLNEAFESIENVILIFSVNRTRHFQGCAKMTSRIGGSVGGGNWKYQHGTAHYGRNFSVQWLKLCELSFQKTRHLRNPYNENLPVKISRDCQELEPSVGEQLASLLYLEPDSELMAIAAAAELKREEEKAKGFNSDSGGENPDIVPFEDNEEEEEEEEEEESEEEDESTGPAALVRGRGRGVIWPPLLPMARAPGHIPGMRGFPPMMMSSDGFPYGPTPGMPDLFSGPRPFGPYGPRFSGDFRGPGMMFPGRPPQPGSMFPGGLGMMMGPGRPPFIGAIGPNGTHPARSGRPMNMPHVFPPAVAPASQNPSKAFKRDQKTPPNERYSAGSDHCKGQDMGANGSGLEDETRFKKGGSRSHHDGQVIVGSGNLRNEESDSEDEAPRRSRHGEGKKKRRILEGEAAAGSDV